ncbi:MAG: hypothetical protein IKJ72_02550, partial [Mycoplasmataceae bacterium]|nr:hypothetical protein [Mycoplasmataceae bacterium]
KKRISIFLILILFLNIFFNTNLVNAYEQTEIMNVYKLRIKLVNLETSEYKIELIDEISDKIYESQKGNTEGIHDFAIATDMDKSHLVNYSVKLKFDNGEIKNFEPIKIDKLIDIDDDTSDTTYSYEYSLRVKFIPSIVIKIAITILIIALVVVVIINLKNYKKRIK